MRTKSLPFQLEEKTGGAFVVQGLAGGMLTGFLFTLAMLIAYPSPANLEAVFFIYPFMAMTGVFGLIKSIPLGAMYHVMGIRMKAPARIATSTIGLTLLGSCLSHPRFDPWVVSIILVWCFLISLPTALLVGSRFRPWEIFTYWRVTFRKHGIPETLRSTRILAILGVLPLRLLSLFGLGIWIVATVASWSIGQKSLTERVLLYVIPITYLAVSAYLTFNSPSKFVLLAIGLVVNLPITYLSLFGHSVFPESYWKLEAPMYLAIAYTGFICAWTAFLTTRFVVAPKDFLPASARAYFKVNNKHEHDCLGSRFLEWREHAA